MHRIFIANLVKLLLDFCFKTKLPFLLNIFQQWEKNRISFFSDEFRFLRKIIVTYTKYYRRIPIFCALYSFSSLTMFNLNTNYYYFPRTLGPYLYKCISP